MPASTQPSFSGSQHDAGDMRSIVHLDQDSFFVSVERLLDSRLEKRPVIIGGGGDRGVVASCSYETRQFGVRSAMPMKLARRLCPEAVCIRGDMQTYSKYSDLVTSVIASRAPLFEKASIDEHYLDISGMDRFFGCERWASELRQTIINETGLPISMGLSRNKTVSKIATGEAKPNGQLHIPPVGIQPFLDPLPVSKIPMVGPKTGQELRFMGIASIRTLRQIPPRVLQNMMGKNGQLIWQRAHGIDMSPVEPWSAQKSLSTETTFETDTIDTAYIRDLLVRMTEKLAWQLRRKQQLTGCVSVKIRYADFDTRLLQQQLPYTSFDHVLIPASQELFRRLYQRRLRIRLVGVRFSKLVHGVQQLSMFEETPALINLYQAMDRIRQKHGPEAVKRAVLIEKNGLPCT